MTKNADSWTQSSFSHYKGKHEKSGFQTTWLQNRHVFENIKEKARGFNVQNSKMNLNYARVMNEIGKKV